MHIYETKHPIAHAADKMFALVADVESYPKFLPLCEELKLRHREWRDGKEVLNTTMVIGYKLIRESFTTEVVLDPETRTIVVHYLDGPFSFLENRWRFEPLTPESCEVDFYIAYSFRSHLLERLMGDSSTKSYGATPLPLRRGPTRSMARGRHPSPHSNEASKSRARSTLSRLTSPRPISPNRTRSCLTGSSRLAAAKCTRPTGLSTVPPPGPAMPVTAMAMVARECVRAPPTMERATSSLTAPCRSISQSGTPSIWLLAVLE